MRESGAYAFGVRTIPPQELEDYFKCKTWGLPNGKGWLDEQANFTTRMSIAGNSFNAIKSFKASKNFVTWHELNPDLSKLVTIILNAVATGRYND